MVIEEWRQSNDQLQLLYIIIGESFLGAPGAQLREKVKVKN